jgi:hypothetical protein
MRRAPPTIFACICVLIGACAPPKAGGDGATTLTDEATGEFVDEQAGSEDPTVPTAPVPVAEMEPEPAPIATPEPAPTMDAWGVRNCSTAADIPDRTEAFVAAVERERSSGYNEVVAQAVARRAQILMSEVGSEPDGTPCVRRYSWRADEEYFYPASAIKTIGAIGAVITLQPFVEQGWTIDTSLRIPARSVTLESGTVSVGADRSSVPLRSILEDTLIESSNTGFNALFDIAGARGCNDGLWELGFESVRMFHRLSMGALDPDAHSWLPSVSAYLDVTWVELLAEREQPISEVPDNTGETSIGAAYIDDNGGGRVDLPLDFSRKNYASLHDLQGIIIYLTEPSLLDIENDPLTEEHRSTLADIMTGPLTTRGGVSGPDRENRFKPMLPLILPSVQQREDIRYVNKAGRAYGFHLDSALVEHIPSGRRVYVAATVFVDLDGTMNDNAYAYESLSFPFLQGVGQAAAEVFFSEH